MPRARNIRILLTTTPTLSVARKLAELLVSRKLVACTNILGRVRSIYRWKGKVCDEPEVMLWMKTTRANLSKIEDVLRRHHPYEVPEFITFNVEEGSRAYLAWVADSTRTRR